jgi:hypothetical protein
MHMPGKFVAAISFVLVIGVATAAPAMAGGAGGAGASPEQIQQEGTPAAQATPPTGAGGGMTQ